MSVTDEDLMAFADGELSGADAERVSAAVAADPALSARIEAERRLRTMLGDHLAPVAAEAVPESLTLMIAAAAAEETEQDMTDAPAGDPPLREEPARVLDFATARAKRQADARAAKTARGALSGGAPRWGTGAAIAASLVLGLVLGSQFAERGVVTERNGALVASGALAKGLDTQLASAGTDAAPLRMLASFRRSGGDFCRVFDGGGTAGIACKHEGRWTLERTAAGSRDDAGEYRQAGSAQGELMVAAQEMAAGEPLDAAQERAAQAKGWRDR
jgi:anti-sigma factor RsiW